MLYLRNMETNEPTLVYLEEAPARTVVESCSGERYIRTHQGGWISSEGRRVSSDYLQAARLSTVGVGGLNRPPVGGSPGGGSFKRLSGAPEAFNRLARGVGWARAC